ncbi:heat shock protein HtpX [compost metagenome]
MKNYKLIAVLILLPLCLNLFGVWELKRSIETNSELVSIQANINEILPELEALVSRSGSRAPMVEIDGERLSANLALSRLSTAKSDIKTLIPLGELKSWLAKAVIALGLLAALVGGIGMWGLSWAGSRALHSRERLLHTFTRVSRILPYVLVGHIILMGAAVASILAFEGLGIWHAGKMNSGEIKLMLVALLIMAGCLYSMWQMAKQLRVMLHMFEPTAMPVLGQDVSEAQAPVLWAHVCELAARLGALAPDHIVLGVSEGFYVTSSDVELLPAGNTLQGRTLHVPMMYLGLLDTGEIDAVIGHELAHFAGADTEYSLRFVPIYDGIGRSLGVIAETMLASDMLQRTILRPAFMLGIYFMESFDHAVNHWSRVRELAADAAGAQLAGNLAMASALVRISAIDPVLLERIHTHIASAVQQTPEHPPVADLPTCAIQELAALPLSLPEEEMATQLPHPSDTHPSNGERIAALQIAVDDAVRSGTRALDAGQACAAMDRYFADPQALRTRITQDYINHYVAQDAAAVEELRDHASKVSGNVSLHEGARLRGLLLLIFCAVLTLATVAVLAIPFLSPTAGEKFPRVLIVTGCVLIFTVACILPFALRMRARADKTALLLTPDHLVFSNFKAPLPIQHIADFGLQVGQGVILNIQLEDDAPLPELASRSFFSPDAKVFKKKRWVQLQLTQFCRDDKALKAQELADLIGSYLNAGAARHLLQQRFEQA